MAAAWETLSVLEVVVISTVCAAFIHGYRHLPGKLDWKSVGILTKNMAGTPFAGEDFAVTEQPSFIYSDANYM
jgi:hypothetical protein